MDNINPPPNKREFKSHQNSFIPNVDKFIYELRVNILNITINEFVFNMNWNNEKYYQQIVNGYKDKNGLKKCKQPTIKFLFTGLNFAMNNFEKWKSKKEEIIKLIFEYIIKF